MTDELAARRAEREDHDAALRGEPLRLAVAEHLENQQDILDRIAAELDRLGKGCIALRDHWAGSGNKSLIEAADRLNDLICGRS